MGRSAAPQRLAILTALALGGCGSAAPSPPPTVGYVDLQRYVGVWHEMARYENEFQGPDCLNVTAEYAAQEDGTISVLNTCRDAKGYVTETAKGWARIADPSSNARLRVTFFWPFFGDYWVVALADDYSWVIVSEPAREYLWILTRTPIAAGSVRNDLVSRAASLGFDVGRLRFTQTDPSTP